MNPKAAMKRMAEVQTPEEFAMDVWVATYARAVVAGGGQLSNARKLADRAAQHTLEIWQDRASVTWGKVLAEIRENPSAEENDLEEGTP